MNPEFQVDFLRKLQRLLAEGGFVATYKFALLHAIADLCIENDADPDGRLTLTVDQLAAKFIDLYWRQADMFLLPSGEDIILKAATGRQAAVINSVCDVQASYHGRLSALKSNPVAWSRIIKRVGDTIKKQPLWKLQNIGSSSEMFLYTNHPGDNHIELHSGIPYCFYTFHGLIIELVRGSWIRFVRRNNKGLERGINLYSFLFGNERSNLAAYRNILRKIDGNICFYCGHTATKPQQVDHFIPWVRYPNDLGHNFVLSHGHCNREKSNSLAAERHLESWLVRNRLRGDDLAAAFDDKDLPHNMAASIRVAEWAYGGLEKLGGKTWLAGAGMANLRGDWKILFNSA